VLVFAIANSGRFETVVIVSNVATFTLYCLACLAAMALMRRDVRTEDPPFVVPGGTLIAVASLAAVLFVMSSATWKEFAATGLTLLMASTLFLIRRRTAAAAVARV
jgi:amino acid transporter